MRLRFAWFVTATLAIAVSCTPRNDTPKVVKPADAEGSSAKGARARVVLPLSADQPTVIEDRESSLAISFVVDRAAAVPRSGGLGTARYPHAIDDGELALGVREDGVEDFVTYATRPSQEALDYRVDVSRVAGLRLVSGVVEFLDPSGAPRLRINRPFVTDFAGRHDADLAIEDCVVDRDPRSPWGRPVQAAGASLCTVRVSWKGVVYPAIVDPSWTSTGAMTKPRASHTATLLATGKVLLAGSFAPDASAELFDPATGTFAATGSMQRARGVHTATLLPTGARAGDVLMVGGSTDSTCDLYDPSSGTFSLAGSPFNVATTGESATPLPNGDVLVAGGTGGADAALYSASTGTFSALPAMTKARAGHSATLIKGGPAAGKVLIASGTTDGSAELYDSLTKTFLATGSTIDAFSQRVVIFLPSQNKVLLMGSGAANGGLYTEASGLACSSHAEIYDPVSGTFAATAPMATGRCGFAATALPVGAASDLILVSGGGFQNGKSPQNAFVPEIFDTVTKQFRPTTPFPDFVGRFNATAVLLPGASSPLSVLIAGGHDAEVAGSPTDTAILYTATGVGAPCTGADSCATGYCVDGVCCNTACTEQCKACDIPGTPGICSTATGAPHGDRVACVQASDPTCGKSACNGTNPNVCSFAAATTVCSQSCSGSEQTTGECDGQGICQMGITGGCAGGFNCEDAKACKTSCTTDVDCATGFACVASKCVSGASCSDDHTSVTSTATTDCSPLRCGGDRSSAPGSCLTSCISIDDCVAPNVCDPTGNCVSSGDASSGGCGISPSRAGEGATGGLVFFLATLIAQRRARRRRAS